MIYISSDKLISKVEKMDQETLRKQRLEAGHALAHLVREQAARLEAQGKADVLWDLLMRWAEAAAEEAVALGVEDASSIRRVLEGGDALAAVVGESELARESPEARALADWEALRPGRI